MTDITPDFNVCLKAKGIEPIVRKEYNLTAINSFLQEAYSLNARITDLTRELRDLRPRYITSAHPSRRHGHGHAHAQNGRSVPLSDSERDRVDAESKQLLRQLNAAIVQLKQVEDLRTETATNVALQKRAKGGLGAIGRWAAGGAQTAKSPEEEQEEAARKTVSAVRESIVLFLSKKLEEAGAVQSEMMDARLKREVEKSKSILAKSPAFAAGGGVPQDDDDSSMRGHTSTTDQPARPELTPEQLQQFAQENHELVKHYEDQLDQVRTAEKSILEISELHSTLHANLQQQSEHIDQLVEDSYLTTENLGRGNKELKRASERRSTAQAVFFSTVAFCSFLVMWDLVF